MIKKPTVFILGAGASVYFGYPSGRKLINKIIEDITSGHTRTHNILEKCGFSSELILAFRTALRKAPTQSIDFFLEHNKDNFIDIVKCAIASTLIPCEDESLLYEDENFGLKNWYRYLFEKMSARTKFGDFIKNEIGFITFNYDRSLEHFFHNSLEAFYNEKKEDVDTVVNHMNIVHIYGQLDYLPWQGKDGRPYDATLSASIVKRAAAKISIATEDYNNANSAAKAHTLLKSAREIHFLGFGYDPANLNRIDFPTPAQREGLHPTYGTAFGLEDIEIKNVKQYFKPKGGIILGNRDVEILLFLKKYFSV
jgi:hypothetical protein